jgi:hypothetical protein
MIDSHPLDDFTKTTDVMKLGLYFELVKIIVDFRLVAMISSSAPDAT